MDNSPVCPYCGNINSADQNQAMQIMLNNEKKNRKSKIVKKIIITVVSIIVAMILAITVMVKVVVPNVQLMRARNMVSDAQYTTAIHLLDKYADKMDDIDLLNSAINSEVERHINAGDYVGAQDFIDSLDLKNVTTAVTKSRETKRLAYESMALYCANKAKLGASSADSSKIDEIIFLKPTKEGVSYPLVVMYQTRMYGATPTRYVSAYATTDLSTMGTVTEYGFNHQDKLGQTDYLFASVVSFCMKKYTVLDVDVDYDRINRILDEKVEFKVDVIRYDQKW